MPKQVKRVKEPKQVYVLVGPEGSPMFFYTDRESARDSLAVRRSQGYGLSFNATEAERKAAWTMVTYTKKEG